MNDRRSSAVAEPSTSRRDRSPGTPSARRLSLRSGLLLGILLPVLGFVGINTFGAYRQALHAADTAYDRTLLASAKAIGESLEVDGRGDAARLKSTVLYSALEAFEADNRSRMYYKVSGFQGEMVSGFDDLPTWHGTLPVKGPYAALVDFYDDRYHGQPVRVAVLLQPVASTEGRGIATIQVAETLELRQTLARQILVDTAWRQAALVVLIAAVVVVVVQRATRPVRELSARLTTRSDNDLTPFDAPGAPRELQPLVAATNHVMARLADLLEHQKRFVRDTSHQLRTPLAVLKTQVQSALRGDVEPAQALIEINHTVLRATELANQMLALAKVEQLRQQDDAPVVDLGPVVRAVALDLAPLIAERRLDFSLDTVAAPVRAHEWALRELTRNLLHNAVKYTPAGSRLRVAMAREMENVTPARKVQNVTLTRNVQQVALTIADSGPGLSDAQRVRLFQPFATGGAADDPQRGSGLGLSICQDIVASLGGSIALDNRQMPGPAQGLDATVRLPLADNSTP